MPMAGRVILYLDVGLRKLKAFYTKLGEKKNKDKGFVSPRIK